jgi:hypothetical protein
VAGAILAGEPAACRAQIADAARTLDLEMPVVDLSGLGAAEARAALESLPAGEID